MPSSRRHGADSDLPVRLLFPEKCESADNGSQGNGGDQVIGARDDEDQGDVQLHNLPKRTSPTSVLFEYSPSPPSSPFSPITPTITMGDDGGVEICLGVSSMNITSATKSPPESYFARRSRSLIDVIDDASVLDNIDTAPSPSPKKRSRMPLTCCGSSSSMHSCGDIDMAIDTRPSQKQIETMIQKLLDSNSGPSCADWQTWSYFGMAGTQDQKENFSDTGPHDVRSILRNRAYNMSKQSLHVQELRRNMDPFGTPVKRRPSPLATSKSFAMQDQATRHKTDEEHVLSSFFDSCTAPKKSITSSPAAIKKNYFDANDSICYDSDPEEFTRRRGTGSSKSNSTRESPRYSYPNAFKAAPTGTRADIRNDSAFSDVIQEFMNGSVTLVKYDRYELKDGCKPPPPVAVEAWIERGQRLKSIFQPKLVWKLVRNPVEGCRKISSPVLDGVNLLDITRIRQVDKINRNLYPLARPFRCFMIKTIDERGFFFEAKSCDERNRIVYSLKLLVARFGAKIVVADDTLFDEFFSSGDAGVPGEAPDFSAM